MPQQTNLNVAPYFDDFDPADDYHKVLFKPGYPVQARELTSLQSILQNQIEKFGQHFFKEGAKVIPGNTGYTQLYYCVQLQNNFQGIPVSAYVDQLIGTKIKGETSGVTAVVDNVLLPEDSERNNLTLYINYLTSNTNNNSTQIFSDGENLVTNTTISRDNLKKMDIVNASEEGGLSGRPLKNKSDNMIKYIKSISDGKIKIIGVGGVFNFEDFKDKVNAGADIVQVYTGWIYEGPSMVKRIVKSILKS